MARLIEVACHARFVGLHRCAQSRRGFARLGQQRFNESSGLFSIKHNALPRFERLCCGLTSLGNYKTAHRLPSYGRGLADDRLVFRCNPGDQTLPLPISNPCHGGLHA